MGQRSLVKSLFGHAVSMERQGFDCWMLVFHSKDGIVKKTSLRDGFGELFCKTASLHTGLITFLTQRKADSDRGFACEVGNCSDLQLREDCRRNTFD